MEMLALAMVAVALPLLLAGFPVAFTLAGTALVFGGIGALLGGDPLLGNLPGRIFGGLVRNEVLSAVPLFIFMGVMLERAKIAETVVQALAARRGAVQGGLGISVVLVGGLLAASTGVAGASVVALGLLTLPGLLRGGYGAPLASGTVAAAGTLGQIMPPSIVLVLLGERISAAHREAQSTLQREAWARGDLDFVPYAVSVGDLFAGAILPAVLLIALYIAYLRVAGPKPTDAPPSPPESAPALLPALGPPLLLIVAVLGSILAGIAPPTEAAALGAVGATILAAARVEAPKTETDDADPLGIRIAAAALGGAILGGALGAAFLPEFLGFAAAVGSGGAAGALLAVGLSARGKLSAALNSLDPGGRWPMTLGLCAIAGGFALSGVEFMGMPLAAPVAPIAAWVVAIAFHRVWAAGLLAPINRRTLEITAMIFVVVIGASTFGLVFRGLGGDGLVREALLGLDGGPTVALLGVMVAVFLLGFFLDFVEIVFVVVPIVAPVLLLSPEIGPIWLGVLLAMNLQTSFLTPPFGPSLFYLRRVAPDSVRTLDIYRGVLPFVGLQILAIAAVWFFPALAEWLPGVVFPR